MRLFLCCSSARTIFPPFRTHTWTRSRSRKTPKFFDTKREIVVGEFPKTPSSHRNRSQIRGRFRGRFWRTPSVGRFSLPKNSSTVFPLFSLNRPPPGAGFPRSKPRRHTNYGGHERTDSLGFGCCWHWPKSWHTRQGKAGSQARASQSVRPHVSLSVCVCV